MLIKNIVDNFLEQNELDIEVLEIFQTGSAFLKKESPADLDYIIIFQSNTFDKNFFKISLSIENMRYGLLFIEKEHIIKVLQFEASTYKDSHLYNYIYALRQPEFGNTEVMFNFFGLKEVYLNTIKTIYEEQLKSLNMIGKNMVHYYLILTLYENESLEITEEIRNNINLLYDITDEHHEILLNIHNKLKEL